MKSFKTIFLFGIIATFSLCACEWFKNEVDPENQKKLANELIRKKIVGAWETSYISGYDEIWNDETLKNEIVSVDRDIIPLASDRWSYRISFSDTKISFYAYEENGWVEKGQNSYSIDDFKILIDGEKGKEEMRIVAMDNNKLVVEIPLKSDPFKAVILNSLRLDADESYKAEGDEIQDKDLYKIIRGNWQTSHVSGYVENNNGEILPIDRDVLASKDDEFYIRAKFDGIQMRVYKYNGTDWKQTELYIYKVEGRKILLMLPGVGETQPPVLEFTVYSINGNTIELGHELKSDYSKSIKFAIERI